MEDKRAPSTDLPIFKPTQTRQGSSPQVFFCLGKRVKNCRDTITLGHLIAKLFGNCGLAAGGRTDEEIEPGQDTVEGAA
jgi:hypothetical protein